MDRDYPYGGRQNWRQPYCVALIVLASIGLVWTAVAVVSFLVVRVQAKSSPGVVVGYEIAGGKERLRVQILPNGFVLVAGEDAWPRHTIGQDVELLSRFVVNDFGQQVQETTAYSPRNYWPRHVVACAASFVAAALGIVGLATSRRGTRDKQRADQSLRKTALLSRG